MFSPARNSDPPLVAHVIHALHAGGLENGVVNLINGIPRSRYRHAVVCLTDYDDFAKRIRRDDVPLISLRKREGKDPGIYIRLWRVFRQLRPDIVHTRNMAAIEAQIVAALARVPCRVHGEHGRDVHDLDGENVRYQRLRRLCRPFIHHFIPLSRDLETYLQGRIGVPRTRLTRISNGVDISRFHPSNGSRESLPLQGLTADSVVIGTVSRFETVKDPMNLVRAFMLLWHEKPQWRRRLRLVMIGEGSLYGEVRATIHKAGLEPFVWLPGAREDVPSILRSLDVFVLPSMVEGVSNTVLEAMACGLPVIATRVGGNPDLVVEGESGLLVPPSDHDALARAIAWYAESSDRRHRHGRVGRERAVLEFSLERMIEQYVGVYENLLRVSAEVPRVSINRM